MPGQELAVWVAVIVLTVVATGLGALAMHQHRQLVDLRALSDETASDDNGHDAIVIMIHNHHEVAASRNRLARGLSALSPSLVQSLVHRETIREVRAQLEAEGIEADVRVCRVTPPEPAI